MALQIIWRLTRKKYASEAFTGEGARRFGGRFKIQGEHERACKSHYL